MYIKFDDLKTICLNILNKAEVISKTGMSLNQTTYWNISFSDTLNLSAPEASVNDLRDDIKFIQRHLCIDDIPTKEDFETLGNVLKAVGFELDKIRNHGKKK